MASAEVNPDQRTNIDLRNERFIKYGLKLIDTNTVIAIPNLDRPPLTGMTPELKLQPETIGVLQTHKEFLHCTILHPFSMIEHKEEVLAVADTIFAEATARSITQHAHVIPMEPEDFQMTVGAVTRESYPDSGEYHATYAQGLILITDSGGDSCYPLLFHELGHSLYPDSDSVYSREIQAFHFQHLCTSIFERELAIIGLPVAYNHLINFPTIAHKLAYWRAHDLIIADQLPD